MTGTNTESVVSLNRKLLDHPATMAVIWSRTRLLRECWDVVRMVGAWPGAVITENHIGLQFTLHGVKLGQLSWDGQLVPALDTELERAVVAEKMGRLDLSQVAGCRVVFDIRSRIDVDPAMSLLRLAYLAPG